MTNTQTKTHPPKILVQTWLSLIRSSESNEVKEHAMLMLKRSIGSPAQIEKYLAEHGLVD